MKVFSLEKFEEWFEMTGLTKQLFDESCEIWANKCEGLSKEEMGDLGYATSDDWMIEVEGLFVKDKYT